MLEYLISFKWTDLFCNITGEDIMRRGSLGKILLTSVIILIVVIIIGFAFVPSIVRSVHNGNEDECYRNSYRLLNVLTERMNGTEENKIWYDLVAERNSNKLLNALNKELDKSVDLSNYYAKFANGTVSILCTKHPTVLDVTMKVPDNLIAKEEEYIEPKSDIIMGITASGKDMYFANSILDKNNPEKMIFTNSDDTNALFGNIIVTAHFMGGGKRVLNRDEYKIKVGELDMTKAGKRTLKIEYSNQVWPKNLFEAFEIYVIANDQREPLIVDGGVEGKYELASWVWTDFVADALDVSGNYMEFGASIVFYDGNYYYYPDGFAILKDNEDNGSIKGARDKANHKKQAYYIVFDTSKVLTKNMAQTKTHNGSLKVDDGLVYIWQEQPSKEQPKGWIRVYCDMKRLK